MVLIYKSDKQEIYQWHTRVWKIFLLRKLAIQNKVTAVVVRAHGSTRNFPSTNMTWIAKMKTSFSEILWKCAALVKLLKLVRKT